MNERAERYRPSPSGAGKKTSPPSTKTFGVNRRFASVVIVVARWIIEVRTAVLWIARTVGVTS